MDSVDGTSTPEASVVHNDSSFVPTQQQPQNHPDLENIYCIDRLTHERIFPNGDPVIVDNENYSGKLLMMVRTRDADEKVAPAVTGGTAANDKVSNYLRPKKRRFEIQLQMKFKKVPDSQMFLSAGYEEPVKLGVFSRASLGAGLRFARMKNPNFSYSLTGKENMSDEDREKGNYENPYFAFPLETSMDVMAITKEGETPPTLGTTINEDKIAEKKRRKEGILYNTNDTYTVCIWSAYIEFAQWNVNLPAVPRFSMANLNDGQPMSVKVYALNSSSNDGRHLLKDQQLMLDVEVSHRDATSIGNGAKKWMSKSIKNDNVNYHDSFSSTSFYSTFMEMSSDELGQKFPDDRTNVTRERKPTEKKVSCCCTS